jgi:hypothetical protein
MIRDDDGYGGGREPEPETRSVSSGFRTAREIGGIRPQDVFVDRSRATGETGGLDFEKTQHTND